MATVSGMRICPACEADLSEVEKGKTCPVCGSDDIVRLDKRRSFLLEMQEKGFSPVVPITTQLKNRIEAIESTPMPVEEQKMLLDEARKTANLLLMKMPAEVKLELLSDVLFLINHKLLEDIEVAKPILSMGMKIGKVSENIDQYIQLRFKR